MSYGGHLVVRLTRIHSNSASNSGGASSGTDGRHSFFDCDTFNNTAWEGNAHYVYGSDMSWTSCRLYGNHATEKGGAIFTNARPLSITDS